MKSVETPQKAQKKNERMHWYIYYINTWTKCSTEGTMSQREVTKQTDICYVCSWQKILTRLLI